MTLTVYICMYILFPLQRSHSSLLVLCSAGYALPRKLEACSLRRAHKGAAKSLPAEIARIQNLLHCNICISFAANEIIAYLLSAH